LIQHNLATLAIGHSSRWVNKNRGVRGLGAPPGKVIASSTPSRAILTHLCASSVELVGLRASIEGWTNSSIQKGIWLASALTYRNGLKLRITVKTRIGVSRVNNMHAWYTTLSADATNISTRETELRAGNTFVLNVCKTYGACDSVCTLPGRCQNLACRTRALTCRLESECWRTSCAGYIASRAVLRTRSSADYNRRSLLHNRWSCVISIVGRVCSWKKFATLASHILIWQSLVNFFVENCVSLCLGPVGELIVLEGVQITGKGFDVVVGLYPLLEPHSELSLGSVTFSKLSRVCKEGDFLV